MEGLSATSPPVWQDMQSLVFSTRFRTSGRSDFESASEVVQAGMDQWANSDDEHTLGLHIETPTRLRSV